MPVQLFVTCLVNSLYPDVGKATVALLERAGFHVEFPMDQTCCGQPAYNGGYHNEAIDQARQTLDVLDVTKGPIVVPSGSCAAMLIHHVPELVAAEPGYAAKATRVAARTRELTQFLVEEAGIDIRPVRCALATYHASCHGLRWLGVVAEPKTLLDDAGVERVELDGEDECCGFGGLFSINVPEVSAAMMDTKLDRIEASGADIVTGVDVACLMHIGGGLRRRGIPIAVKHIAEVLAGDPE
ncbi:MAG: (Fe-S)-binding protein [Acidimicrobiia bacterium]|nr:(Fe-S)-binding protein [Acidimicrobiia bacterium]